MAPYVVGKTKSKMNSLVRGISERWATPDPAGFRRAADGQLFVKTDPKVDGDDCLHDCQTCTIHYPRKFSIDEGEKLYGFVKGWSTHLVVATGKTDWVRDVEDEKGSIMEAVRESGIEPSNGKMMLSASNMPHSDSSPNTRVLLLPAFKYIDNVTTSSTADLIKTIVQSAPTNTTPLDRTQSSATKGSTVAEHNSTPDSSASLDNLTLPHDLKISECPHQYLILLCSQATRDARCGQSAPLLRREFERHLRPLGLYRDLDDDRPGGVGIYFISHVGGHKFSANLMIYRRASGAREGAGVDGGLAPEAAQCIWLARVRPEDCENIVRYTVLQGKVVKPEWQLRGGFDRSKQLVSW